MRSFEVSEPQAMIRDWLSRIDERLSLQLRFLIEDCLEEVIRGIRIANDSRRENTAEHSWHLAIFAMVLSEYAVEKIYLFRVVEMLLLHDLAEIECGDTPLFGQSRSSKPKDREELAAEKLFGMLPLDQAGSLRSLWNEFENSETPNALFAKAIDRLHNR